MATFTGDYFSFSPTIVERYPTHYGTLFGTAAVSSSNPEYTPPVLTLVSPSLGSISASQIITINITDPQGLSFYAIEAIHSGLTLREVIYDSVNGFGSNYTGGSNTVSTITNGKQIAFLRDGNWPNSSLTIYVSAVDAQGALVSTSYAFTPPAHVTPSISSPTPSSGSSITKTQAITFTVTAGSTPLERVVVFATTNSDPETVHTGSAFTVAFDASSTRTGSASTSYDYSIVPDAGWFGSIVLNVIAYNTAGEETTTSWSFTAPSFIAPSIGSVLPTNLSTIASSAGIFFAVIAGTLPIERVVVTAISKDTPFLVHDGTAFSTEFDASSIRSGTSSTAYSYSIYSDTGWFNSISLEIIAYDTAGNEAFLALSYTAPTFTVPLISPTTPTTGTSIASIDPITFFVAAESLSLERVIVTAITGGVSKVVHNGTTFSTAFNTSSTRTGTASTQYNYSIVPNDGWADSVTLSVIAYDVQGNEVTSSSNFTAPPSSISGTPPSISTPTPAAGSNILKTDSIGFTVTSGGSNIERVIIIAFNDGIPFIVYDGTNFSSLFNIASTVTGTASTLYTFSLNHNSAWKDPLIIKVFAYSAESLEASATWTFSVPVVIETPVLPEAIVASVTEFEAAMKKKFTNPELEKLRALLLQFSSVPFSEAVSIRSVLQMAFDTEISALIDSFVPINDTVLNDNLSSRNKYLSIDNSLNIYNFLYEKVLTLLITANVLEDKHADIFRKYLFSDSARQRISAVSALICYAVKMRENGAEL